MTVLTDLEMLELASRATADKITNETDEETLRWLHRLQTFITACTRLVEAVEMEEFQLSRLRMSSITSLSRKVEGLHEKYPEATAPLMDYVHSMQSLCQLGSSQETAAENHGYLMMKLEHVMPWPRTFVDQLESDLHILETRIAKRASKGENTAWEWRAKMLVEACLKAAAAVDKELWPRTTNNIECVHDLEEFAKTVRKHNPAAAKDLWEFLNILPFYDEGNIGRQMLKTQEEYGFVNMYLPSIASKPRFIHG